MALALLTFVASLAVMLGVYWAFIVRPEDDRSKELARRVQHIGTRKSVASSLAKSLSTASVVDALLASNLTLARSVQTFLEEAGLPWTASGLLARALGCAGLVGAATLAAGLPAWVAAPLAAAGTLLPLVYARYRRGQRLAVFEEQFPEAIDLIARSLRAGHTLTTGLGIAADEVPPPVGLEFRRVFDEQNFGMSLPEALKGMARRVPVLDARFFVTAVLTQRETGGNLAELLDNLSGVMRERFKVRRQIRVVSAHGRLTAWILSLLPPILGAVLYLVSPQFMQPLFDDPLGLRMLTFAVGMQVLGTFIISRLVRVEY